MFEMWMKYYINYKPICARKYMGYNVVGPVNKKHTSKRWEKAQYKGIPTAWQMRWRKVVGYPGHR
jgi:hypothetical protein